MQQNNLANNVKHLIEKNGITSAELANVLSVSSEAIGRLKKGELENPSLNMVTKIAKHFDVSLDKLVFDKLS